MADELDDDWLKEADRETQIEAMRGWFLKRYEDPANETPWDGEDKAYIFVWGGPYDPSDVIQGRFGDIVEFDVMWELIQDLHRDVGEEWAPIEHEGAGYDDYIRSLVVYRRDDPINFLMMRMREIEAAVDSSASTGASQLALHQMAHGALISALEAYLSDTVLYWTGREDSAFRKLVSTNKDFQARTLKLSELFERLDALKEEVKDYLTGLVWHRLDKVKALMVSALEIPVPAIGELMKEIICRHDIVHRAGRNKDGDVVTVTREDLHRLRTTIAEFALAIDVELTKRFPLTDDDRNEPF